jgi:hypothetical protein
MRKLLVGFLIVFLSCACVKAQYFDFITQYDFRMIKLPDGVGVPIDFTLDEINNTINLSFYLEDTSNVPYYITPYSGEQIDFFINNTPSIWAGDTATVAFTQPITMGIWEICSNVVTLEGQQGWSQPKYINVERRRGFIMILMGE